jgi:hypothetical protein
MAINIWDIFIYIYRWKYLVAAVAVAALLFTVYYANNNQSYSASVVIKYSLPDAQAGSTATGQELKVYEIIAPHIITAAIKDSNINLSAEFIRTHISIEPIIPKDQEEIKKAKIQANEEYSYTPVYYMIKFTVGKPFDGTFARDVLDAVIKNYYKYYSETHIHQSVLPEIISSEDAYLYDYLEIAELMDSKVTGTIAYLNEKTQIAPEFRSSTTGMSFSDIISEYRQLKDFILPSLISDIFNGQITKNKEVLLKNQIHKKNDYMLTYQNEARKAELTLSLMREFVRQNEKILQAHEERSRDRDIEPTDVIVNESYFDVKTTYDKLVDQFVSHRQESGAAKIKADYCDRVIAYFSAPAPTPEASKKLLNSVQLNISEINESLTELYKICDKTIRDYNEFVACQAIYSMSGISIYMNLPTRLYYFIACFIGLALGILTAICIEIIKKARKNKLFGAV